MKHEACGPLVFVGGVNALERFFYVVGIEPDQRILSDLRPVNRFRLNFIDGALAVLLTVCHYAAKCQYKHQQEKARLISSRHNS
jgi:hypothetical protein